MYYFKEENIGILLNWYKYGNGQLEEARAADAFTGRKSNGEASLGIEEEREFPYDIESVAEDLYVPWALDITKDGRIFFTERNGNIRLVEEGVLQTQPVYTFGPPFTAQGEGGLLGLALDTAFTDNGYFYVMYSYMDGENFFNRVVRMHYDRNKTTEDKILIDRIPGDRVHNGGRLKLGPDGKLYATTGDAAKPELAQDINSLAGKILRLGTDGSIPGDNPFPNSYVYAYGLRNSQGIDWNENRVLYASDNGETAHDKISIIIPGGNYGWPAEEGNFIRPIYDSGSETYAPSGIAFAKSGPFAGKLLVATLRGEQLLVMTLSEDGKQVLKIDSYLKNEYGRLRAIYFALDGSVYISTSNLDGRGLPNPGDDKIIRLIPRL